MFRELERFVNVHGETWIFEIDDEYNVLYVRCDDYLIDGIKYAVLYGQVCGVVVSDLEKAWILETWFKYAKDK